MIVYYCASLSHWRPEITREAFEKETEHFLIRSDGRRVARNTSGHSHYKSWDNARQALIALHEQRVSQARHDLQSASSKLGNIKGWKNPEKSADVAAPCP